MVLVEVVGEVAPIAGVGDAAGGGILIVPLVGVRAGELAVIRVEAVSTLVSLASGVGEIARVGVAGEMAAAGVLDSDAPLGSALPFFRRSRTILANDWESPFEILVITLSTTLCPESSFPSAALDSRGMFFLASRSASFSSASFAAWICSIVSSKLLRNSLKIVNKTSNLVFSSSPKDLQSATASELSLESRLLKDSASWAAAA